MTQTQIEDDVYFQQAGLNVSGVYVNAEFINIKVDRELNEEQLKELGIKILDLCKSYEPINNVITDYKHKYIQNSGWDIGYK
ncbi:hypothetical protein [Anaerosporobacter sp.]